MKKVFLSVSEDDLQQLRRLMPLLISPDYDLDFYEMPLSVDFESKDAESIRRAIGERVVHSDVTLCLIGNNTHKSKWVDCALKKSRLKGNRIIAMALKKIEAAVLPDVIREDNITFYPWDPKRLNELIGT
jgi:hypothetical protein